MNMGYNNKVILDDLKNDVSNLDSKISTKQLSDIFTGNSNVTVIMQRIHLSGNVINFYLRFKANAAISSSFIDIDVADGYKPAIDGNRVIVSIVKNVEPFVPETNVSAWVGFNGLRIFGAPSLSVNQEYDVSGIYLIS